MNVYSGEPGHGGFGGTDCSFDRLVLNRLWQKRLYSYFYFKLGLSKMIKKKGKKGKKVELFLDSGAYSAWSQKKEIDIHAYIKFIKDNKKAIAIYANLDDINSPDKTWENQKIMEKAGLKPLPVYHFGEDDKYLVRLLDKGYDYISLGGMVPISNTILVQWLDRIFSKYLTDKKGMPKVKVHGFGLTSLRMMLRYNWYSVDSTSWVITGRMGSIYIPRKKKGVWVYDEDSWKVTVSSRSPGLGEKGKHFHTMREGEKKILLNYIESKGYKLGKSSFIKVPQDTVIKDHQRWAEKKPKDSTTFRELEVIEVDGVSNRYQLRDEMNILYFLDLEKSIQKWPWAFKKKEMQKGFFE